MATYLHHNNYYNLHQLTTLVAGSRSNAMTTQPTRTQYEQAAKSANWHYSPAHDGWINNYELDGDNHVVMDTAEDACYYEGMTDAQVLEVCNESD